MRMLRDLSVAALIRRLERLGYVPSRQTGGHVRLTSRQRREHHLTVPHHDPLRIGTLSTILTAGATLFGIDREEPMRQLFE